MKTGAHGEYCVERTEAEARWAFPRRITLQRLPGGRFPCVVHGLIVPEGTEVDQESDGAILSTTLLHIFGGGGEGFSISF